MKKEEVFFYRFSHTISPNCSSRYLTQSNVCPYSRLDPIRESMHLRTNGLTYKYGRPGRSPTAYCTIYAYVSRTREDSVLA